MAGTLQITGTQFGLPDGTTQVSLEVPLSALEDVETHALAIGHNVIPVPLGATGVILLGPYGTGTVPVTLKGAAGDVGVPLSGAWPSVLALAVPAPATLVLDAAATVSLTIRFF